jgi:hypothetical protein
MSPGAFRCETESEPLYALASAASENGDIKAELIPEAPMNSASAA